LNEKRNRLKKGKEGKWDPGMQNVKMLLLTSWKERERKKVIKNAGKKKGLKKKENGGGD